MCKIVICMYKSIGIYLNIFLINLMFNGIIGVRWVWRIVYIEINWIVKFRLNISKLVYNDIFLLKIYKFENKLKI